MQRLEVVVADVPEGMKMGQELESVLVRRIRHLMPELERLEEKMDIEQAAFAELQAGPFRPGGRLRARVAGTLEDEPLDRVHGPLAEFEVAGDGAHLQE